VLASHIEEYPAVLRVLSLSVVTLCLGWSAAASAASPPSEVLFPNTTKGWVSVPNVDMLRADFKLTQIGKMVEDPVMQPFMEDLGKQLQEKLDEAGVKLGLKFADLDGVYGGEVASGLLKPDPKDKTSHAVAMTVDVTGKHMAAQALLAKIDKNMLAKGAKKAVKKLGASTITSYTLPKRPNIAGAEMAIYALEGNTLIASDSEPILIGMLGRLAGKAGDSLGSTVAYKHIAAKVHGKKEPLDTHVRWFVDPLGYAEAARAANGGKVKRGLDKLATLRAQGFGAIQGVGGRVDFHDGEHEVLHQSFVYAPADAKAKAGLKYVKAANILDFPNGDNLEVQDWVPNSVSSYLTVNWNIKQAFKHFGSLFDAFADEPGTWEEILAGLESDPHGPKIDVNAELIALLGQRVTAIVDHTHPINPSCERVLVAIELDPADAAAEKKALAAIRKLMKVEKDARQIDIEGHDAWEVAERNEEALIPDLQIDSPEFVALEGWVAVAVEAVAIAAPVERKINWAITVANGHILVGTHVGLIADSLKAKADKDQLKNAADLARVRKSLVKLGSGNDSFRFFTRSDEACHPTYELLKKGLMPKAETILGRTLNQAFAPIKKGELRKQEINGKKLPEWEKVAGYFGPAGTYVQSEGEGWLIKGCLLDHQLSDGETKKPEEVAGGSKKELE